ncbi:Capsular polysaccharide type 8 biosynthesis protein cap8A [Candidatus Izimaplasma bacterium HR1]|uniref:YveK family protein n=1 Tax=Candidatus Izimoplasma sp. HR1 TaxID=1541959 RepID=UPI0004F8C10A|nr:Capsular polysaccharide type 8 biosynthesis protein cap8A [Candidatus Izimaplasma bacterium HR1]
MNEVKDNELEIDIMLLLKIISRKWIFISLITVFCTVLAGIYSYVILDDVYSTETSMIVQVESTLDSEYTNLMTGQRLVDTYTEISKSHKVLEEVIVRLPSYDFSVSELESMINVTSVHDTLIVKLTVEGTDKYMITNVANTVTDIVQEQSTIFSGLEDIEVFDQADVPLNPSGPNRFLYVFTGMVIGIMVGVVFVLLIEFLDKNIKNDKDIENHLNLRVLGTIPEYDTGEAG